MSLLPRPVAGGRALVLRHWPVGETSTIASALIDGHGLVRLVAKGARQPRSRLRPLVQPGRLVDLEFSLVPGRELQYLRGGVVLLDPLGQAPTLERTAYLLAAVEIIDRCWPGHGHESGLFALGEAFVRVLSCADAQDGAGLFYAFEIALLALMGMRPQIDGCTRCGVAATELNGGALWFSPAGGGLVCGGCAADGAVAGAQPLGPALRETWRDLAAAPDRWPAGGLARPVARYWGVMLHRFLAYHLPGYRLPAALRLLRARPAGQPARMVEEDRA